MADGSSTGQQGTMRCVKSDRCEARLQGADTMQATTGAGTSHARAAALGGLISLVARNPRRRERLYQSMQQLTGYGAFRNDIHVQAEAARSLFGARARELTIFLAKTIAPAGPWSCEVHVRHEIRELLAAEIVTWAGRALTAAREGEQVAEQILESLRSRLSELGDLGDIPQRAAACESTRLRPPDGFTTAECDLLREGPILAVLHLSLSACNGPRELLREFRGADLMILNHALESTGDPAVGAVFHAGICYDRLRQLADNYPSRRALLARLQSCMVVADEIDAGARVEYVRVIDAATRATVDARKRMPRRQRGSQEAEERALGEIERLMH
jgi:hypothetical protein